MATSKPSQTGSSRTGKASAARKPVRVHASPTSSASAARAAGPARSSGADRHPVPAADPEPESSRFTPLAPAWLQWTTFVLSIIGVGVSAYLTNEHFAGGFLGCSENGLVNCAKVTTSAQSWVWVIPGHWAIPVSVLGLAFFLLAAVPLMSPWAWRVTDHVGPVRVPPTLIPRLRLGTLVVGMAFVLYLVYAEFRIIKNICLYCTGVHVITFLLFVLTIGAAAMWGLNPVSRDED